MRLASLLSPFLFLIALHVPTTFASRAALAYAATSKCNIVSIPGQCDPDVCFQTRGRYKHTRSGAPVCYPHIAHGSNPEILERWMNGIGCRGCRCTKHKEMEEPSEGAPRGRVTWVWGQRGGVVRKEPKRGSEDRVYNQIYRDVRRRELLSEWGEMRIRGRGEISMQAAAAGEFR